MPRWAGRDVDGLMDLHADDFERIDHRTLGWGETTKAESRELFKTFFAAAADSWFQIDEVLACDDRVIAVILVLHGKHRAGGGSFEIPAGVVVLAKDGHGIHDDVYAPEDREAMLARYAELSREL